MSSTPIIATREPAVMELSPGTYYWCACGKSTNQPFCDGSHEGNGIEPVVFTLTETKTVTLCCCKHSKNPPFCDGSHANL